MAERVLDRTARTVLFGDTAIFVKEIAPGYFVGATGMIFTTRVWVGDSTSVIRAFCYEDPEVALAAARAWDGDGDPPDGWIKEVGTERRRINGDPAREYDANENPTAEGV